MGICNASCCKDKLTKDENFEKIVEENVNIRQWTQVIKSNANEHIQTLNLTDIQINKVKDQKFKEEKQDQSYNDSSKINKSLKKVSKDKITSERQIRQNEQLNYHYSSVIKEKSRENDLNYSEVSDSIFNSKVIEQMKSISEVEFLKATTPKHKKSTDKSNNAQNLENKLLQIKATNRKAINNNQNVKNDIQNKSNNKYDTKEKNFASESKRIQHEL